MEQCKKERVNRILWDKTKRMKKNLFSLEFHAAMLNSISNGHGDFPFQIDHHISKSNFCKCQYRFNFFREKINRTHFNWMAFQCICNGDIFWLQSISNWIDKSIPDEWMSLLFVCFFFILFCLNVSLLLLFPSYFMCTPYSHTLDSVWLSSRVI